VTAPVGAAISVNTATVSAATADPDLTNNTDQVTTTVTALADLSMSKKGPASVVAGGTVSYSIKVKNAGPSTATSVSVSDTLPAGVSFVSASGSGWTCGQAAGVVTCTRPTLTTGAAPVITINVTAPVGAATSVNTATVSAATADPDLTNNTDQVTTTVGAAADLQLVKTGPKSVVAGELLAYTITVTNNGPDTATSVVVTDPIPAGTTFVSATGVGWTCAFTAGVVTCTRPVLSSGDTAPGIALVLNAPSSGDGVVNRASVRSDATDPVRGNNSFGTETILVPSGPTGPDLPDTGADGFTALVGGLLALLLGLALVRVGRRRSTHS
jgi:uncharacterized repeat protein (TIGR01451 family)/LPXTG-motif cell wall-anchored protein